MSGATGNVGGRAAELLVAKGLPVRLLVRDLARAPQLPGAEVAIGHYADDAAMDRALAGIGTAFFVSAKAPPVERAKLHDRAFTSAKRAGVGHVVYLSLQGAAPDSSYPYSRDHWTSERALKATGLPHTILRNGKYAEQILEMLGEDGAVRGPADDGRVAWITREDSARMVAAILEKPPGGTIDVTGPDALTLDETMAILSSVVDRWLSYAVETVENARGRSLIKGEPEWRADLAAGAYVAIAHDEYAQVSDAFERFVGEPPKPFWRWALGNPALDKWHPSLDVAEKDVAATIEDLGWIDDLDDPAVQGHLGVLARQFEGTTGTPELIEAFLALFERFPETAPELEGNRTALFMLSTLEGVAPILLRSLDAVSLLDRNRAPRSASRERGGFLRRRGPAGGARPHLARSRGSSPIAPRGGRMAGRSKHRCLVASAGRAFPRRPLRIRKLKVKILKLYSWLRLRRI